MKKNKQKEQEKEEEKKNWIVRMECVVLKDIMCYDVL